MMLFKTIIKVIAPFIILLSDIIYGALVYMDAERDVPLNENLCYVISHTCGSSIFVVLYIIAHSTHMCIYYKTSCYILLCMHIFTIIYIYTDITFLQYIYYFGVMCMLVFITWVISLFTQRTACLISQSCKH